MGYVCAVEKDGVERTQGGVCSLEQKPGGRGGSRKVPWSGVFASCRYRVAPSLNERSRRRTEEGC